jgi:hypothetical protein
MNIGMNAYTRFRSTPVICRLLRMTKKYATAATTVAPITMTARFDAVITPTSTTTTATATMAIRT